MDNKHIRHLSKKFLEERVQDVEVLYDNKGRAYEISDVYYISYLKRLNNSAVVQSQKAKQIIDDGFKMLTKQQKRVMILYVQGVSFGQMASLLKVSHQRISQLKKAAVKKLRNYIPSIKEKEEE